MPSIAAEPGETARRPRPPPRSRSVIENNRTIDTCYRAPVRPACACAQPRPAPEAPYSRSARSRVREWVWCPAACLVGFLAVCPAVCLAACLVGRPAVCQAEICRLVAAGQERRKACWKRAGQTQASWAFRLPGATETRQARQQKWDCPPPAASPVTVRGHEWWKARVRAARNSIWWIAVRQDGARRANVPRKAKGDPSVQQQFSSPKPCRSPGRRDPSSPRKTGRPTQARAQTRVSI